MNYNNRIFRGRSNDPGGEVGNATTFHYYQSGDGLSGDYSGGSVVSGHLLGKVHADGSLEFCYHHLNTEGELMAGQCKSRPEYDADGILVLKEHWQWLIGDRSSGQSEVEEVTDDL